MTSTSPTCSRAVNALFAYHPPVWAATRHTKPYPDGKQLRVIEEDLSYWTGTGARQHMASVARTPARCPKWSFSDPQYGTVTTDVTRTSYPRAGEEVMAYRLVTHWRGRGDTNEVLLFARSDNRVLLMDFYYPVGRPIEQAELNHVLDIAVAKLPGWRHG